MKFLVYLYVISHIVSLLYPKLTELAIICTSILCFLMIVTTIFFILDCRQFNQDYQDQLNRIAQEIDN
jgi:hypothetical protein